MFVIGAAIGYLLGSGTIAPSDLLNPAALIDSIMAGL